MEQHKQLHLYHCATEWLPAYKRYKVTTAMQQYLDWEKRDEVPIPYLHVVLGTQKQSLDQGCSGENRPASLSRLLEVKAPPVGQMVR